MLCNQQPFDTSPGLLSSVDTASQANLRFRSVALLQLVLAVEAAHYGPKDIWWNIIIDWVSPDNPTMSDITLTHWAHTWVDSKPVASLSQRFAENYASVTVAVYADNKEAGTRLSHKCCTVTVTPFSCSSAVLIQDYFNLIGEADAQEFVKADSLKSN